jgi:LysR family transcriptional regulator, benzoate and cis,cis-muconate-responsive activator of ben and cat genes
MELRHLRYFIAVGEELSFTRAAERLHIAQPPLSQQIRQLEEELGVTLFERGTRPLRLTEAGQTLLDRSRGLLASLGPIVDEVRRVGRGQLGKLAIGFAGSAMFLPLPEAIVAFRQDFPGVEITLDEMLASEIADGLRKRRINIGFARPGLASEEGFAQRVLLQEPYVAALPAGHAFASRGEISLGELADEPFILYPVQPGPSVTDLIIAACQHSGFSPRIAQEAMHLQTVISLVAAGIGVSLVPWAAARSNSSRPGLAFVSLSRPALMAPLTMVRREDDGSPALRRFMTVVEAAFSKNGSESFA